MVWSLVVAWFQATVPDNQLVALSRPKAMGRKANLNQHAFDMRADWRID
jgi:hypothetical protein